MEFILMFLFIVAIVAWSGRVKAVAALAVSQADATAAKGDAEKSRNRASIAEAELQDHKKKETEIGVQAVRIARLADELVQIQGALVLADALLEERESVIYPRRFPEATTEELKERMAQVRQRQSEIRRKGQVVIRFGASVRSNLPPEELAKLKNLVRLARLALEGAADTLLDQVKATNQDRLDLRFRAVTEDLNKLLRPWGFEIGKNYQGTVRESLELAAEYAQQQEKEREEQRALREQMREEAAAQREAERAQKEAEEQERRAHRELARAMEAAAKATVDERERWFLKVQELEQQLAEAHSAKDRAIAMAQLTKAGHVYVISNIGAFGETVFKIGMTRRLDPEDRIEELGDASVPFPFDIHGMIKSQDAPGLEAAIHSKLEAYRLNLVNFRKEFFRAPFALVQSVVKNLGAEVQLTEAAEAVQFRQSESLRKGLQAPSFDEVEEGAEESTELPSESLLLPREGE
jgi:hypothetical protein